MQGNDVYLQDNHVDVIAEIDKLHIYDGILRIPTCKKIMST